MAESLHGTAIELRGDYLAMSDVKLQEYRVGLEAHLAKLAKTPALYRQQQDAQKLLGRVRFEELARGLLDQTESDIEHAERIALITSELGTRANASLAVEDEFESASV